MRQVLGPGALGRPRGMGWGGRLERGSEWGIHITAWLIHVNVWQKTLQYCKVISLQLIKVNGKNKNKKNKTEVLYLNCTPIQNYYALDSAQSQQALSFAKFTMQS